MEADQLSKDGIVLTADPRAYLVAGGILGFAAVMSAIAAHFDSIMKWAAAACVVALLFSWLLLSRYRLTLGQDSLVYRSPFRGTVGYRFTEIESMTLESGASGLKNSLLPLFRLVVQPRQEMRGKPIYINTRILSRSNFRSLLDLLQAKSQKLGRPEMTTGLITTKP